MDAESESLIAVMQSKLIDQVRRIARTLHVATRTEEAYVGWISRYLIHHRNQHGKWIQPLELGSTAVNRFLSVGCPETAILTQFINFPPLFCL